MVHPMKLYLVVTGLLFALLTIAHIWRTIAEWSRFSTDPWFIIEGPGIGLLAAGLAYWAWRLFRKS
jgi:cytochrome c oxidase subunit IV